MGQGVFIHHILKQYLLGPLLHLRSGGQLHPQDGAQFIDDLEALVGVVVVALIHKDAQVWQGLQIGEVGLTQHLDQPLDPGGLAVLHLAVGVQLGNIKNVDDDVVGAEGTLTEFLLIVPVHDTGRRHEFIQSLEHILLAVGVAQVRLQLFVDRQVGRHDKEMSDPLFVVQIGNTSPHEPGLANACSQSKANRRKVPLKRGQRGTELPCSNQIILVKLLCRLRGVLADFSCRSSSSVQAANSA